MSSLIQITRKELVRVVTPMRWYSSKPPIFDDGPSPPKLSKEEQKEFDEAVKKANTQMAIDEYNEKNGAEVKPSGQAVLKTIPEFEGNVNPKTGEVNGPKQDPTRHGDWSFNGRVTDF
ncbi:DEKNAAC105343 [Brettanomyces naardenensis]|uniref:Succinate dehydrogenase assembly factor 4, mitochondrial n=1 Tax=Brettanomyces naardenensis TaxID=13370 RepID=A0A448YTD2_BRENA|nr:DEKNAAC105343 [Brettanomyces naardenensis]